MPAINSWIVQIINAQEKLKIANNNRELKELTTIDERNEFSIELMEVMAIPFF